MNNNFLYLTYYQVMIIVHRLEEMKKENPYFNDEITSTFYEYFINRASEISSYSTIKTIIIPGANKFKISKGMVEYLINLTGIDVLNKKIVNEYIPVIKEIEKRAITNFFENAKAPTNKIKISKFFYLLR